MSVIVARCSGVLRSSFIKVGEINHEAHEEHEEFAVAMPAKLAGLFSWDLFAWIAMCLRLITGLRGVRSVKPLKTARLHLPPRTGAWS
jgi:hypothetical protein